MKRLSLILCGLMALGLTTTLQPSVTAQTADQASVAATSNFVKKRYSINGEWTVLKKDGHPEIQFSENFKTKNGPDLKVYLSPNSLSALDGKSALNGAYKLGVLKSSKGEQTYSVPADINLSDYKSVIIQCEAFSVLWGGFDLPDAANSAEFEQD